MILPDKTIALRYSFIGAGSRILIELESDQTVSSLWERVKNYDEIKSFDKYLLILDFLYVLNLIEFEEGILKKVRKDDKTG